MDARDPNAFVAPDFFDILATLPLEEQRVALEWLRSVGTELGCTIDEEVLISEDFLDFIPNVFPPRSLN